MNEMSVKSNMSLFPIVLGFILFRGANSQKDNFRRDPNSPSSRSQLLTTVMEDYVLP